MRPLDRIWWFFDVERSRWNTADKCNFSIGGGILVPEVYNILYYHLPPIIPESAHTGDCIILYTPECEIERHWVIKSEDDVESVDNAIIKEIRMYIETKIMRFYERFTNLDDVMSFMLDLYENRGEVPRAKFHIKPSDVFIPLHLAILYWLKGDQERACAYLEEASLKFRVEWWQQHLVRLRERLGCG